MGDIRILIVEDEQRLASILKQDLEDNGYYVDIAMDGIKGQQMAQNNSYNLIILDINLPLKNGYELCKEIRKTNEMIPIIMLTAMGTSEDKVTGFDAGADDYVVKPFDFRELQARIRANLKRIDKNLSSNEKKYVIADLEMDLEKRVVTRKGMKIDLSAKEFSLLEYFIKNKGKILTRSEIADKIWNVDFDTGTNVIDVYINYLRKKIDKDFETKLIHTKFGHGFYLNENEF